MKITERCSLEEAIALVKENLSPIEKVEEAGLLEASGRILAEDIRARFDQPPFARSPLDGYALKAFSSLGASKETPITLKVVDEVMAGHVSSHQVEEGEAIRIMTGAPIPSGADCVIRQENTDYGEEKVEIYEELTPYANYCFAGEDYKKDELLLTRGIRLTAAEIGLLASVGRKNVKVYELPKIYLMTTGDEILMPGEVLQEGKIYDSNLYTLAVRLKELGFQAVIQNHVLDDAKEAVDRIREFAADAKVILTTGGVSVGKKDIMHEVYRILGAKLLFWKLWLKPGTPVLCAKYGETLLIGLSGNPYAAVANMETFVRPVLAYLSENPALMPLRRRAVLGQEFRKTSPVRRYVRAIYAEGRVSLPVGSHSSGCLRSMCGCNCLLEIPANSGVLHEGDEVWVCML